MEKNHQQLVNYIPQISNMESIRPGIQINSEVEGPHVILTGGTHGNELVGLETFYQIHNYFNKEENKLKKGKITMIISNPEGVKNNQRFIEFDLNRSFNFEEGDALEIQRAQDIKEYFSSINDKENTFLIDLHSVSQGDFTFLAYPEKNKNITDIAKDISPIHRHFMFRECDVPGTLIEGAVDKGINSLVIECGNHYSDKTLNVAITHIENILHEFSMIDKEQELPVEKINTNKEETNVYKSFEKIPPGIKFYDKDVKSEDFYEKGKPIGETDEEIFYAPQDCFVIMPDINTTKKAKDAGFLAYKY